MNYTLQTNKKQSSLISAMRKLFPFLKHETKQLLIALGAKKLQKIEPSLVKQNDLVNHAEELGVPIMTDESGAIIILDEKDLTRFVNLLNDDYVESGLTGLRYEIKTKRILKPADEDDLLKEVLA